LVSRDLEVALHGFDVISVVNDHVLDRIKVDGQGVLVVESDASHFTFTPLHERYHTVGPFVRLKILSEGRRFSIVQNVVLLLVEHVV
jgi:hypothetical protein